MGLGHTNQVTTATKNDFFAKTGIAIRDIVSGNECHHQIAITKNNELYGVGGNTEYQLGISDQSNRSQFTKLAISDNKSFKVKQVACSSQYSTFLTVDGGVYICGKSSYGGLGCGPNMTESKTIRKIDNLSGQTMTQIACGYDHTLSIDDQERVWSWGRNNYGQLGHGHTNTTKEFPKIIQYLVNNNIRTIQVVCGRYHCLSLGSNHRVYAWGCNSHYECADGTTNHVLTPQIIDTLKYIDIVDIQAGSHHNVALSNDHTFYVWGHGAFGECLTGAKDHVKIPTQFHPQTDQPLSTAIVLSIQPGWCATNVIVMRDPQTWARRQIAESTDYVSMVTPNLLPQLLRDEVHETHRLTEERKMVNQQLVELETDNKSQKKEIESMSIKMKKLNETIEEQKNKEQALKEQLKGTQKTSKDRKNDIERMSKEIEGHQKSLKAQEKQIQSKSREINGLQKEATAQQRQFRSLQQKLQTQEQQNVSMARSMNQLKAKVQSQEKDNQSITKQLKGLQKDMQVRDGNIEKMKKHIKSQQKAHKVQETENQLKTQQIVRLQERLQVKDQEEQALRQTLQTREEQNTSMEQQLERLQQDTELRTADINRLNAEIVEKQRKLRQQEEEKLLMTNQLEQIRNEGMTKDQAIEALEERLRRSYTLSAVHDDNTQTDEKEDNIEGKEQERTHGDGALYKKHCDIVTEWNTLTEKLEKLAESLKIGDDDEKQASVQQQGGLSADNLLDEYENAYRLINRQKARLEQVKDLNLSELILHQNELSVKYLISIQTVPIL